MSRESLLDEAIIKAKECEDWQLVEWLRMARGGESAARWYSDKLRNAHRIERKLMDENTKLRELVARLICHIENPPCESCMAEMSCAGGEGLTNCDEYQFMVCDARELGVMDG